MSYTVRKWAIRECNRTKGNIDWAGSHLQEVINVYKQDYPEQSAWLEQAQECLLLAIEGINLFINWL